MACRMAPVPLERLAAELPLRLDSPGLCLACLWFFAVADPADERELRRCFGGLGALIWEEGFGETLRRAVVYAVAEGVAGAEAALVDLDNRRWRSAIFRAAILRLADEQRDEMRRMHLALLN